MGWEGWWPDESSEPVPIMLRPGERMIVQAEPAGGGRIVKVVLWGVGQDGQPLRLVEYMVGYPTDLNGVFPVPFERLVTGISAEWVG